MKDLKPQVNVITKSFLKLGNMLLAFLLLATALVAQPSIELNPIGTHATGIFDESGAEIVAFDPETKRLFATNVGDATIDVLDLSDPTNVNLLFAVDVTPFGKNANSVAVHNNVVAVAIENVNKQAPGVVVFFDTDGNFINQVTVGALPDMITFTPNGRYVLVANEGEPNADYTVDPEGSVSVITMDDDPAEITQSDVRTASFVPFNNAPLAPSIRIFGPGATVAQDLEPEFIAVSANSRLAWVSLQENNAIALIDVERAKVLKLQGLGFKDHSVSGNGFDASNKDGGINITTRPTLGMYQPDALAAMQFGFYTFILTANEGDAREYEGTPGYVEETRVKDIILDPVAFPDAASLQMEANLGRLKVTTANGDIDHDGDFDKLYSFGARSFSIWSPFGFRVFDSGDDFEQITAAALPDNFNSTDNENGSFDDRSDDKGPEPEGIVVGRICARNDDNHYLHNFFDCRTYAFIGLERIGGIMVYDVTNPFNASFVTYINTRDFNGDPEAGTAGDLAPEGLLFIPKSESPISKPLLVVANEVSGTTTVFEINSALSKAATRDFEGTATPSQVALHQNYPNPFNPSTTITYSLPNAATVAISVFNLIGQKVAELVNEPQTAGNHSVTFSPQNLPSGIYLYRLEVNNVVREIRKLTFVK